MSTHNICFQREIRKIFNGYPPLSRPMTLSETLVRTITVFMLFYTQNKHNPLSGLDILGRYSAITAKGDNFCDIVCFIACQSPSVKGSALK